MTPQDLKNDNRQTGFDHVQYSAPRNARVNKPYQAIAYRGKLDKAGRSWKGPRRASAIESAQDYCDHVNGVGASVMGVKRNTAGHSRVRDQGPVDPLREEALRLLAETTPERGTQGFVYCISDGTAVKIGRTSNHPSNRIAELQTGNPRLLKLLAFVETDDATAAEIAMHRKFAHLNVLGEWFEHHDTIMVEFGLNVNTDGTVASCQD